MSNVKISSVAIWRIGKIRLYMNEQKVWFAALPEKSCLLKLKSSCLDGFEHLECSLDRLTRQN